ncbi:unnamed protein product [Porites evermanni]|uniref:Uncharacterized protein n=1 Tax=Porites evermanni TaxID=104178 RepID=A0ABN8SQJ8_9CNID|nr:unnamed protein product [Porites evermanni]
MRAEDGSEVKRKLWKPTQRLKMRRYDRGSFFACKLVPVSNSAHLTGRLELTGRHREQQVPRLYLGWQHVLGLVKCWIQKTVKKWTVPKGVTRHVLEVMWRGHFVLAGPLSLNLKAMAATPPNPL